MDLLAADMAVEAVRLVLSKPAEAQLLAGVAAALAKKQKDVVASATAERALGLAAMHLSDFDMAVRHLRRAIRLATDHPETAAEARMNLGYVLSRQGKTSQALHELDLATGVLRGPAAAWLAMYRGLVLKGLGVWEEALAEYRSAQGGFQRTGDRLGLARLHMNRGVLHLYRQAYDAAEADFLRAEELFQGLDQPLNVAILWHNLGCVSASRADAPTTLARFERARVEYEKHRRPPATLAMDRCEFALSMGLAEEATAAAREAIEELHRVRQQADLAEAQLLLAKARLLDDDPAQAREAAVAAAEAFRAQRRPRWAALARYIEVHARTVATPDEVAPREVTRAAAALERAGWAYWAVDARLTAGRLALGRGDTALARRELAAVAAWRRRGTAQQRAQAWHAEALLRVGTGDRRGASRAVGRGIAVLREHHASLGATDLRASASANLTGLAQLGLTIAMAGRPARLLAAVERVRAAHLLQRPVRPPGDDLLARDLTELRRVGRQVQSAIVAGRPTGELRRRLIEMEGAVRDRFRLAPAGPDRPVPAPSAGELAGPLGDRALVEYFQADGDLHALTLCRGRLRHHALGPVAPVVRDLTVLPFLLRRLALRAGSPMSLESAVVGAEHVCRRLDQVLLKPLARTLEGRALVIVPTPDLQAVTWSLLPSCHGVPVSVAPSATLWHRAAVRAAERPAGQVVLVAGPGLAGARSEVGRIGSIYPDAVELSGDDASVEAVLKEISGAGLVHLATHGSLRLDNPLFSYLRLGDGPLTVYDLERLPAAPNRVILSACESGRGAVLPSGAVLGLVGAFLALGTVTLIGNMLPVLDPEAPALMVDLHRRLRAGAAPAEALAAAQRQACDNGDIALAGSLVCFGEG
ncbi:CHAT domain-containing protein [Virgisporangium ochraceum]|uniref:CHAT domain-containing protein n=1 Tax=Virgisporangium ochraceum TaxID=65505 RepID=A0A8J4A1B9_9ACTN|nr:CHAT domain-containing tetratricopeptide repeat protein [Virgisporangium ochraceum]GIJ73967.1 CHAT domain-containing protein [Virgisporangium ochraceum]